MAELPPELITDIFTRLPVESVLRFRCLSKPWCSQIDSPAFKKAHLSHSLKTRANHHVLLGYLGIRAVDLNRRPTRATVLRPPSSATDFTSSINGLVLVLDTSPFLWNPFTRKSHKLPSLPPVVQRGFGSVFENFGLGYDSTNDDYVVVRVVEHRDKDRNLMRSEAMIYSRNSGKWRKTCNFPYALPYKRVWGVPLNGVLHTATYGGDATKPEWFINGFDFVNEKHIVVPKPQITGPDAEFELQVLLDGHLCLVRLMIAYRTDIWIMKEYGVKESWTLLLSVAPPAVAANHSSLCPLTFSKDGQEVLLNLDDQRLIWYHLKKKTVRNEAVKGLPSIMFYAHVCVASLLHPGPQEAGQQQRDLVGKTQPSVGKKSSKKRDGFLSKGFNLVL